MFLIWACISERLVDPRLLNQNYACRSPGGELYGGNTSASVLFDIGMSQINEDVWMVHTDKDTSELRAKDRGHIGRRETDANLSNSICM